MGCMHYSHFQTRKLRLRGSYLLKFAPLLIKWQNVDVTRVAA